MIGGYWGGRVQESIKNDFQVADMSKWEVTSFTETGETEEGADL